MNTHQLQKTENRKGDGGTQPTQTNQIRPNIRQGPDKERGNTGTCKHRQLITWTRHSWGGRYWGEDGNTKARQTRPSETNEDRKQGNKEQDQRSNHKIKQETRNQWKDRREHGELKVHSRNKVEAKRENKGRILTETHILRSEQRREKWKRKRLKSSCVFVETSWLKLKSLWRLILQLIFRSMFSVSLFLF